MDIKKNIESFINGEGKNKGKQPTERYASFDYCFNYFQSFRETNNQKALIDPVNLQTSCLQLAFYLASWGMFRGSSFLLERSSKFFEPLIHTIANISPRTWDIDADSYDNPADRQLLLQCKEMIVQALGREHKPTDTLVTKIMLGVFGNVPAFDSFFRKGFSLNYLDDASLVELSEFYKGNKVVIDSYKVQTFDFGTGKETARVYTKAKIIDMIGFIEGQS